MKIAGWNLEAHLWAGSVFVPISCFYLRVTLLRTQAMCRRMRHDVVPALGYLALVSKESSPGFE